MTFLEEEIGDNHVAFLQIKQNKQMRHYSLELIFCFFYTTATPVQTNLINNSNKKYNNNNNNNNNNNSKTKTTN